MTSIKKAAALASLCALAAVGAATNAHAAPAVANGGFTDGLAGWTVYDPTNSGSSLNTTPGIGVTVITTGTGQASTPYGDIIPGYMGGTHAAYFVDDNAFEWIAQTIQLAPYTEYTLGYGLFSTLSGAGNANNFTIKDAVTNEDLSAIAALSTSSDQLTGGQWVSESETFMTGGDSQYNLSFTFTSGSTPAKDVLLTDVAIPEPASLALLGVAMFGTGAISRRRRQSTPTIG